MTLTEATEAHLETTVRTWLGLAPHEEAPRLPDELARRLLRAEEYEHAHRDRWGNWEFGFCESYRAGRLWEPDVDRWVAERRRELGGAATEPWPDGRPLAVCLTHDVDLIAERVTPQQAVRSMRTSLTGPRGSGRERLVRAARPGVRAARALRSGISAAPAADALERCAALERESGVPATYFFTVYPGAEGHRYDCTYDFGDPCRFAGERTTVADVIRALDREGFEIGLHGSYNSALAPGRLEQERAALVGATGLRVTSTRQHFVHWDVRATPRLQAGAGLTADSTLGFNRNVGFRAGTSLPFRWFDLERGEPLDLVEVPFAVQDGALLREDALELGAELALDVLGGLLDRVAAVGGVATLNVHPNNLERPEYEALLRAFVERGRELGAWFATVRELDAWWRAREAHS